MPTHYKGNVVIRRSLDTYIKLVRAADSLAAESNRELRKLRLSESQFGVLEALLHLGPLHQCELARKLLKTGGNVTLVLDNLERRGLIRRKRDSADRRTVTIELTASGRELIQNSFPAHAKFIAEQFSCLTADEQSTLGRLCRKLGKSIVERNHPSDEQYDVHTGTASYQHHLP